ncbi:retrovirus-related pol polyprotein from transposon TNT 1-94 [Tanacetum coccineum]
MKSIKEGAFLIGNWVSDVITRGIRGFAVQSRGIPKGQLLSSSNPLYALKTFRKMTGNVVVLDVGGQYRGGVNQSWVNAKPIKCYNCNGLGHIARECPRPKRIKIQTTEGQMLLMQARKVVAPVLDEEQSLFLAGEQVTNVDDNVDDSPENDLALNVDHVFEADECDAFGL